MTVLDAEHLTLTAAGLQCADDAVVHRLADPLVLGTPHRGAGPEQRLLRAGGEAAITLGFVDLADLVPEPMERSGHTEGSNGECGEAVNHGITHTLRVGRAAPFVPRPSALCVSDGEASAHGSADQAQTSAYATRRAECCQQQSISDCGSLTPHPFSATPAPCARS
jgi:hypothetical protein